MPKILKLTVVAFSMLNIVFASKMLAGTPSANNSCPPLSKAVIPLDHPIVEQLNKQYRQEGSMKYIQAKYRQGFTANTVWPHPHGRVTGLVKVGDYGLANWGAATWTTSQLIVVYFQKNQLRLGGSELVGHFEDTCINCLDAAAAVESADVILRKHDVSDADIKCLNQLDAENDWRISGKNGGSFWKRKSS
jgi:hypothetical protein